MPGKQRVVRFGLDVAQQRMPWSEVASRARFADGLGFDGVWGFDHFQPMYGDGPGECFEGNTTLAALTGITGRVRLGLLLSEGFELLVQVGSLQGQEIVPKSVSRRRNTHAKSNQIALRRHFPGGRRGL